MKPAQTIALQAAFAAELRAARLHAGMTKAQLARRAGMTRYGLVKVERRGNCS